MPFSQSPTHHRQSWKPEKNWHAWRRISQLISFLLLGRLSFAGGEVSREIIKSASTGEKIEFYWAKPAGKGPFPALLMIHPEQDSPKTGGEFFVKSGQLDFWTGKGFLTIAVSQPGYGSSEGKSDFCGPKTQEAALEVIGHFQAMPEVRQNRFFVYGGSRGAVVASILATHDVPLAGIILKSGVYNFEKWVHLRPWYDSIKLQMLWEMGWLSSEKLRERSASYFAEKIKAPLLVIHGTRDDRAPIELAENFVAKVNASGGKAQLMRVDSEHIIPMPQINGTMEKFMSSTTGSVRAGLKRDHFRR